MNEGVSQGLAIPSHGLSTSEAHAIQSGGNSLLLK